MAALLKPQSEFCEEGAGGVEPRPWHMVKLACGVILFSGMFFNWNCWLTKRKLSIWIMQ
ncbi:hypothetical protein AAGG52_11100 [Bacillus licheniformis]